MERKELVTKALEAGITKAHTMKSVVLEEMLLAMETKVTTGKRGRPIVENSVRQLRLKELEEKRLNGELKRGRPVDTESVRQKRIADIQTRKESLEVIYNNEIYKKWVDSFNWKKADPFKPKKLMSRIII